MSAQPARTQPALTQPTPTQPTRPRPAHIRPVRLDSAQLDLPSSGIPAPTDRFLAAVAAQAVEAISGSRTIMQLGSSVTVSVARKLAVLRALHAERAQMYRDVRHIVPRPGHVHKSRVRPDVYEVAVVLHTGNRSRAVAMRVEWAHGHWRACALDVL